MPQYTYSHDCGLTNFKQFMREDKETLLLKCNRCGRRVTAKQIRDNSQVFYEKEGLIGIANREQPR